VGRGTAPDDAVDLAAVSQDDKQRDRLRVEALRQTRIGADVDLDDLESPGMASRQVLQHRADHAARTAPLSPEVDDHRHGRHLLVGEAALVACDHPRQARKRLILAGTEEMIRAAVLRPVARASGLRRRLWRETVSDSR
jgi:hypothetical protein